MITLLVHVFEEFHMYYQSKNDGNDVKYSCDDGNTWLHSQYETIYEAIDNITYIDQLDIPDQTKCDCVEICNCGIYCEYEEECYEIPINDEGFIIH